MTTLTLSGDSSQMVKGDQFKYKTQSKVYTFSRYWARPHNGRAIVESTCGALFYENEIFLVENPKDNIPEEW